MAFIPLAGGIKVRVQFTLNGVVVYTFHWVRTLTPTQPVTPAQIDTVLALMNSVYLTDVPQYLSTALAVTEMAGTAWDVANGVIRYALGPYPITGTVTGDAMPGSVALVASLRTGQTGRSYRGRNYWPGIPETQTAGNNVTAPFAAQILDIMTDLQAVIASAGTLVVASFQANGVPRVTGVSTAVNQIIVNTRVDTQRRRLH